MFGERMLGEFVGVGVHVDESRRHDLAGGVDDGGGGGVRERAHLGDPARPDAHVGLPARGARGWPVWGYHPGTPVSGPRVVTVGDAAGIDGLTGEGIGVAMEQAVVAGDHIAEGLARQHGFELRLVEPDQIEAQFGPALAVLMLTHVNYRTGRMHDMAALTRSAHACGALALWDLAHSAGALPVDLGACDADFAVGCGYKYLNGGPGAPAFAWAHPRHADRLRQPLAGWMGHAAPFDFDARYTPAPGAGRSRTPTGRGGWPCRRTRSTTSSRRSPGWAATRVTSS